MIFSENRGPLFRIMLQGVAKVARRSAFGKGGSLPADAFPRRFTDLSQAEPRRNLCDQGLVIPGPSQRLRPKWPARWQAPRWARNP